MIYKRYILVFVLCSLFVWTGKAEYRVTLQEALSGNKHVVAYVDGVKVDFTLDTGCSTLTISKNLFEELVRKGAVKRSELSEVGEAELANGEMHDVQYFTIKRLQLGDYVMHNVRASIGVHARPDADPLLGQSVLNRCEYYAISNNGQLIFEPKPEEEQKALVIAQTFSNDTSYANNAKIVEALRPYAERLSPRHLIIYAQALEYINEERTAIPIYTYLINSDVFSDEDGKVYQRLMNAKVNYAEQLYHQEAYGECETLLHEIIRESKQEPIYTRGLNYSYNTLCYLYWQTKEYDKAEKATLQYCNYLLSPRTWEYLENHAIEADENLAKLLNHLSKYCSYNDEEAKAKRYERMARNAGFKE